MKDMHMLTQDEVETLYDACVRVRFTKREHVMVCGENEGVFDSTFFLLIFQAW